MKSVKVIDHLCPQNHPCPVVGMCPQGAIQQNSPFRAPTIDKKLCTNCSACTYFCAYGAIRAD